ncbi:MAG: hypothetical protein ACP6IY_21545 [Promethearchaeia archaeon]
MSKEKNSKNNAIAGDTSVLVEYLEDTELANYKLGQSITLRDTSPILH